MLKKFNLKKNIFIVALLLILLSSTLVLVHYTLISYGLSGTYSAGNEPDKGNICMVLKNERFTIYNQEKILESGLFEKINLNSNSAIYKLVSAENSKVGYIVYDKNRIILLDFKGMDFMLKKMSSNAIYLDYQSD